MSRFSHERRVALVGNPAEARVALLNKAQWHQGPDHGVIGRVSGFTFGNTRLVIEDPGPAGKQPFSSADGALLQVTGKARTDSRSVARHLRPGALAADQSPFEEITVLPPNSVVSFDQDCRSTTQPVWGSLGGGVVHSGAERMARDSLRSGMKVGVGGGFSARLGDSAARRAHRDHPYGLRIIAILELV
jgi:hypothetical protein